MWLISSSTLSSFPTFGSILGCKLQSTLAWHVVTQLSAEPRCKGQNPDPGRKLLGFDWKKLPLYQTVAITELRPLSWYQSGNFIVWLLTLDKADTLYSLASEQALRGALAAGRKKEGDFFTWACPFFFPALWESSSPRFLLSTTA